MPPLQLPATEAAVRAGAELVQQAWLAAAQGVPLSEGLRERYVAGLTQPESLVHPHQGDLLKATVINVAPEARWLEQGRPAVHLPSVINWAGVTRRTQQGRHKGRPYLFIPFRHAAARSRSQFGAVRAALQRQRMSWGMYQVARRLGPQEFLTAGPTRGRARQAPGLTPYVPAYGRNVRLGYTHAARQERLRRYPGVGKGSLYLTFRTITPDSSGWWLPPIQGLHLRDQVYQATQDAVARLIEDGVRQDLDAMLARQGR